MCFLQLHLFLRLRIEIFNRVVQLLFELFRISDLLLCLDLLVDMAEHREYCQDETSDDNECYELKCNFCCNRFFRVLDRLPLFKNDCFRPWEVATAASTAKTR